MRSTPRDRSSRATSMDSSTSNPPSTQSAAEIARTAAVPPATRAHRRDHLEQQPGASGEAAAVSVLAVVGERREERVQEVAVGGVDLDEPEAGGKGALAATANAATMRQRPPASRGSVPRGQVRTGSGSDRPQASHPSPVERLPPPRARRWRPCGGVGELDAGHGAARGQKAVTGRSASTWRSSQEAEVGRGDPPPGLDRGGLGEHEARRPQRVRRGGPDASRWRHILRRVLAMGARRCVPQATVRRPMGEKRWGVTTNLHGAPGSSLAAEEPAPERCRGVVSRKALDPRPRTPPGCETDATSNA